MPFYTERAEYLIKTVPYLTIFHLMPYCYGGNSLRNAFDQIDSGLQRRRVKRDENGRIIPNSGSIDTVQLGNSPLAWNRIWFALENPTDKAGLGNWEHDHSVIDVCVAFANHYGFDRNWNVKIWLGGKNSFYFEAGGERQVPDALIQLTDSDYKNYHFILENNNSDSPQGIARDKVKFQLELMKQKTIRAMREKKPYADTPVMDPKKVKFLHVNLPLQYSRLTFARPCFTSIARKDLLRKDPDTQIVSPKRKGIENDFNEKVIAACKGQNVPDNVLFLPLHKFPQLHEAVWKTAKGHSVKII